MDWVLVGLVIFLAGLGFGWACNFFGWIGFWNVIARMRAGVPFPVV